jgi:uncharacterized protein YcfJ
VSHDWLELLWSEKMKKILSILSMLSLCGSVYAADFTDTAQVISSKAIYERVAKTHRECSTETVPVDAPREHSVGGAVVGGVVGALIGSEIGQGTGKKAATVAGGVAGAVAGDRIASKSPQQTREVERCRDVENPGETVEVLKGYKVTYRYKGQDITTVLPYQPDSTVHIRINVIEEPH